MSAGGRHKNSIRRAKMKKRVKTTITILLTIVMLWCGCTASYASETDAGIAPCLDYIYDASMAFVVIDPGVADFFVSYNGNPNTFMIAKLTVTFEKKVLGLFWRTVDIGTENNEWIGYNTDLRGEFYDYVTLDGTGTYRANFRLQIYGADSSDIIEETIACIYN